MIKRHLCIALFLFLSSKTLGQNENVRFDKILNNFKEAWRNPLSGRINDSVTTSSLYKTSQFNVSISSQPIAFDTNHVVVKNPFYTDDFEDYDDNYINYPVSYSVVHDNRLISLFRNGKFICHNIGDMKRDLDFEKILNKKKFKYHWIINGKLAALSNGTIYTWDNTKWTKLRSPFPMVKRPKLFEDSEFIVFGDCFGEFGGTVYFFDKVTKHIYFTESTCSNSVFKKDGKYFVLSELGHSSNSEIKLIDNPRKLTRTRKNKINKLQKYQALGYSDKSGAFQKVLDFWNIQLFSTFKYQEKQLYLVGLNDLIFLAEIIGTEIQIVHPLFNNDFIIHDPVTNQFGNYILINYSIYGTALEKEVCVIIIDGKKITKVDWNENHSL